MMAAYAMSDRQALAHELHRKATKEAVEGKPALLAAVEATDVESLNSGMAIGVVVGAVGGFVVGGVVGYVMGKRRG